MTPGVSGVRFKNSLFEQPDLRTRLQQQERRRPKAHGAHKAVHLTALSLTILLGALPLLATIFLPRHLCPKPRTPKRRLSNCSNSEGTVDDHAHGRRGSKSLQIERMRFFVVRLGCAERGLSRQVPSKERRAHSSRENCGHGPKMFEACCNGFTNSMVLPGWMQCCCQDRRAGQYKHSWAFIQGFCTAQDQRESDLKHEKVPASAFLHLPFA